LHAVRAFEYKKWWLELGSNQRRLSPTDLQSVAFDRSAIQPLVEPQCGSRENILPYIPHLSISAEGKMPSQNVENPRQFKTNETVANAS
jgi:hypothetical protein